MAPSIALLLAGVWQAATPPPDAVRQWLPRVSEEAEAFRTAAGKMLAQETLVQRALKPPARFRPRVGEAARQAPAPQFRTVEIISEYGFASLKEAPGAIHEFRQVVSVDGRQVMQVEKARATLTSGIRSEDDRVKKRLIEEFEKHGLIGAAADFGQVLLLFTRANLERYVFEDGGRNRVGVDTAAILNFRQQSGPGSLVIFDRRKAIHQPLEGELWVRVPDGLPLRILLRSLRKDDGRVIRDEAAVEYTMTPHGVVAPASVVHRQYSDGQMVAENVFHYSPFRLFGADTQIKFETGPEANPRPKQ